jgi:hypothetical protein
LQSVTWDRSVFFPGIPVSSTNKADRHDIAELLLKVALNTINIPQFLCQHTITDANYFVRTLHLTLATPVIYITIFFFAL